MKVNKTTINLEADKPFEIEITGPKKAKSAIILVHGFGVKRDSRGMFVEIENIFSNQFLCVRGDFTEVADDHSKSYTYNDTNSAFAKNHSVSSRHLLN